MKFSLRWCRLTTVTFLLAVGTAGLVHAQSSSSSGGVGSELETREALEAEAAKAEEQHRSAEAWLLRTRLKQGDFQEGDKILVRLLGSASFIKGDGNDTVTVRAGKLLPLPQMKDMSLEGVLRSELTEKLTQHLANYLRDPSVRVTPLLRLAVLGQVGRPGYFYVPADILLNDAVMRAGGPNASADVDNMVIKRGSEIIWNAQDTRTALSDGLSLDRLHLKAGDILYVDDMNQSISFVRVLQYAGPLIGVLSFVFSRLIR